MDSCPKCGHRIVGRPNFCPACGASLTFGSKSGSDPLIGRTIGGYYEIDHLIGEGAMGRVYQATHVQLRKKVALKILRSNLVGDTTVVRRFEREALAASRLNHPNCISIHGFGQEDDGDLLWMAMEYIQGRDLGTIINEESPLSTQRVVNIIGQVCEALDEAHSANIIHRDLKPANIVCFDHRRTKDFVKVLDFGIAKITDPGEDYQPLTRDGIVCGTPAYMSPEQVQGFELDNRSDLFSLGIILYQTLAGQLPFFAESAVEVATKIVIEEPVPASKARLDWSYPPELEAVVNRLLQKKKENRFRNAVEVKEALEACVETLRERRDASLDLNPDEVAELMADVDEEVEGAATLQLSSDVIRRAMAAETFGKGTAKPSTAAEPTVPVKAPASSELRPASPQAIPRPASAAPGEPQSPGAARNTAPPPPSIMTGPTTAFHESSSDNRRGGHGLMLGIALVIVAVVGAGAWWLFADH